MNISKMSAYLYIFFGCFLVLFFGGTLLLQLLGVFAGILMIRHGLVALSSHSMFQSFTFFSQDRFR